MKEDDYYSDRKNKPEQPFRRTGPLDAYIYKEWSNDGNVENTKNEVMVHLPRPVQIQPQPQETNSLHIFTDGACTNNGRRNASAAWGVLVLGSDHRIIEEDSGKIPPREMQTNQRAELRALLRGFEIAESYINRSQNPMTDVQIWSDSQYSIKCTSEWGLTWRKNGWTKKGGDIQHLDIIKPLVQSYTQNFGKIRLKWVEGHKGGAQQHQFPWMFNHRVDVIATAALQG